MTTDHDEARARLEAATYEASKDPRRIDANRVKELTIAGKSIKEIAQDLGCAKSAVSRARSRMGVNQPQDSHRKVDLDQLRELHDKGLSREEIAAYFNCAPDRVTEARKLAGLPASTRHHSKRPRISREEVKNRTEQGQTLAAIAQALDCSVSAVIKIRHEVGVSSPAYNRLTPERKARIEAMLDDGCPYAEISRTLHVDHETLTRHFPGRAWTREQQTEHLRTIRKEARFNWGHQQTEAAAHSNRVTKHG